MKHFDRKVFLRSYHHFSQPRNSPPLAGPLPRAQQPSTGPQPQLADSSPRPNPPFPQHVFLHIALPLISSTQLYRLMLCTSQLFQAHYLSWHCGGWSFDPGPTDVGFVVDALAWDHYHSASATHSYSIQLPPTPHNFKNWQGTKPEHTSSLHAHRTRPDHLIFLGLIIVTVSLNGKQYQIRSFSLHSFYAVPLLLGLGAVLRIEKSLVRFQMVSLEFFIDINLPIALWPWGWLSL